MKGLLWAFLILLPGVCSAERYSVKDSGDFAPMGHRVEFADRYGWRGYQVEFDFSLDQDRRGLSRDSRLKVRIAKRDGKIWTYTCKAKGKDAIQTNINYFHGKGISVVAECRIPEKYFAEAVDLDERDVGRPTFVFQAMIVDGKVVPGAQRGLYFVHGPAVEALDLDLQAYADTGEDPTSLAVVFRSN